MSKHTGRDFERAIKEAEEGDKVPYGVLDSSCGHNRGLISPSIADEMISEGVRWRLSGKSAGLRVAAKNRLRQLLRIDEEIEKPGLTIFNNCRQLISDLPVIPADPKGTDDIDPRYASDHTYDALRYGIMSRIQAPSPFMGMPAPSYQPADTRFGY